MNQGTNASITCNATNATYYDITINNGLIPDTNGVSSYLFNIPGVFNINCTVWNSDYSHSATCPAKVITVQSTAPQCQSFTVSPNPVQVGQPVTMVCDGNQFSNTYQILVNAQNGGLVSSFNGSLPGPNNLVTTIWTPNAPGTYTFNCAVSNNNTQVAQCPGQTVTVLQPGQPDLWITKTVNPNQVASGGLLTFTITFGNSGSVVATGVTVQDLLPPTVNYVGGSVNISLPGTAFNSTNTTI